MNTRHFNDRELAQAYLNGELKNLSADEPLPALRPAWDAITALSSQSEPLKTLLDQHLTVIAQEGLCLELVALLSRNAVFMSLALHESEAAQELCTDLRGRLAIQSESLDAALVLSEIEWRIACDQGSLLKAVNALDWGITQAQERRTRMVLSLLALRCQTAMSAWMFSLAERDLAELAQYRHKLAAWGFAPWSIIAASLAMEQGRINAAKDLLDGLDAETHRGAGSVEPTIRARIAALRSSPQEAERLIAAWEDAEADPIAVAGRLAIPRDVAAQLRSNLLLVSGDKLAAIEELERPEVKAAATTTLREQALALTSAGQYLALGQIDAAQSLYDKWRATNPRPWTAIALRIALGHNRRQEAQGFIDELLEWGGWTLLTSVLRLAPECAAWQLAQAFPSTHGSRPKEPVEQEDGTPRQRLRRFLQQSGTVTRKQVVAHLGCSPVSARRWLNELVDAGCARYRNPSSHPRTGYWECLDGGVV